MLKITTMISYLLIVTNITLFANEEAKEMIKEAECMSCHNKEDFKPTPKKNFTKLHTSVQACQLANDAGWFDDETLDVSRYLNKIYYKYEEKN